MTFSLIFIINIIRFEEISVSTGLLADSTIENVGTYAAEAGGRRRAGETWRNAGNADLTSGAGDWVSRGRTDFEAGQVVKGIACNTGSTVFHIDAGSTIIIAVEANLGGWADESGSWAGAAANSIVEEEP